MTDDRVVVGVFADPGRARQALHELQLAGFPSEHIGFLVRNDTMLPQGATTEALNEETGIDPTSGAVTGGVLGGVIGAAAALLIPGLGLALAGGILATVGGAALGAATGGLIAVLTHMGVPEEEARSYEEAFQAGRTIVIVQAEDRLEEAYAILKQNYGGGPDTVSEMMSTDDPEATVELEPLQQKQEGDNEQ